MAKPELFIGKKASRGDGVIKKYHHPSDCKSSKGYKLRLVKWWNIWGYL
jgi:hypothetical protein